jgi:hypothetical protein
MTIIVVAKTITVHQLVASFFLASWLVPLPAAVCDRQAIVESNCLPFYRAAEPLTTDQHWTIIYHISLLLFVMLVRCSSGRFEAVLVLSTPPLLVLAWWAVWRVVWRVACGVVSGAK